MYEINTQITINTNQISAWKVLTDFNAYHSWSTFIDNISGETKNGCKLKVTITPLGKKSMDFSSKLLVVKPNDELRWCGVLFHPLIFRGEHYFILEQEEEKTRLIHGEKFTGLLVPILNLFKFFENTQRGFEAFNLAFEKQVNVHHV